LVLEVEEQREVKILVFHDHIFVESLELVNKYLHSQDNEYRDDLEHEDYFLKHDNNDTSIKI
jgi:hypothetical protein